MQQITEQFRSKHTWRDRTGVTRANGYATIGKNLLDVRCRWKTVVKLIGEGKEKEEKRWWCGRRLKRKRKEEDE